MPDFNPIQTNFNAGEFSPRLKGRVDLAKYNSGAELIQNFIALAQGGLYRRSGTRFVIENRDSTKRSRLLEFEFSILQAYMIEASETCFRFFKDGGVITNTAQNITGVTNTSNISITCVGHGYTNGQWVYISGVLGTTIANGVWKVTNASINAFELDGSTGNGVYISGGTVASIVEVVTPYLEADLRDINYTQSADVMYLANSRYWPRKLSRTSHTSWTLTQIDFQDGPYLPENKTATTITPSAATGSITLTASTSIFASTDVGRLVRMKVGANNWGWLKITGFTSTTVVSADVQSTLTAASATTVWRLGAWSETTGFPSTVCFHEERLCWGSSPNNPQTTWLSTSADYENMAPSGLDGVVGDSNAMTYTIASNQVNAIRWMDSGTVLLLGTTKNEFQLKPASTSDPLTSTNVSVTPQTAFGSKLLRPRRVGSAVLFISRSGRKVREMVYDFSIDGFVAKDLSLLAEHLFRLGGYVVDVAYQQEPDSVYWIVMNSGLLVGMTYIREQDVVGFHRQVIGGNGLVEAVGVIPKSDGTQDQTWLSVKRTINGQTKRYIEYIEEPFDPDDENDKDGMFFVDAGLTYSGAPTNTVTNLFHLEGEEVQIVGDGAVRNSDTVSNGEVTVDGLAASTIHVGKGFISDLRLLNFEGGSPTGTSQVRPRRIDHVVLRMMNSLGLKIGRSFTDLKDEPFRRVEDDMDDSPPLFTGDFTVSFDGNYDDTNICIRQDQPYPMTILSVMPTTRVR